MKIYIIAGEASGDLHASNLIKAIHQIESKVSFRCWGGDKMKDAGATIVKHIKELAFMGFIEVLFNLNIDYLPNVDCTLIIGKKIYD